MLTTRYHAWLRAILTRNDDDGVLDEAMEEADHLLATKNPDVDTATQPVTTEELLRSQQHDAFCAEVRSRLDGGGGVAICA